MKQYYHLIEFLPLEGLREKHRLELENLTLTTEPVKTVKFFVLAVLQYLKRTVLYLLAHGGWLMVLCTIGVLVGILLLTIDGPHEKVLCSFSLSCVSVQKQGISLLPYM